MKCICTLKSGVKVYSVTESQIVVQVHKKAKPGKLKDNITYISIFYLYYFQKCDNFHTLIPSLFPDEWAGGASGTGSVASTAKIFFFHTVIIQKLSIFGLSCRFWHCSVHFLSHLYLYIKKKNITITRFILSKKKSYPLGRIIYQSSRLLFTLKHGRQCKMSPSKKFTFKVTLRQVVICLRS